MNLSEYAGRIVVGGIFLLCLAYLFIGGGMPASVSSFVGNAGGAGGIAALFTGITGLLVALYLHETHLLRRSAEAEYAPFMILTFDPSTGGIPNIYLRNLGRGPAVNVEIHGLRLPQFPPQNVVRFQFPAVSPANPLPIVLWSPSYSSYFQISDLSGQRASITYSDPAGRRYQPIVWIVDPSYPDGFRPATPQE